MNYERKMACYKARFCKICHSEFLPNSGSQRTCSAECRRVAIRKQKREYMRQIHPNRCNACGIGVEKYKQFCEKHRDKVRLASGTLEELLLKNKKLEQAMDLNEGIVCSQQQQIDELLEKNAALRKEKQWLEKRLDMIQEESHYPAERDGMNNMIEKSLKG